MKVKLEKLGEKGITLIFLIIIILLVVAIVSVIIKGIFDFQTMGATIEEKLSNEEAYGKYVVYVPDNRKI